MGERRPRVVIVGLGPAGPELATAGTVAAIERVVMRFGRTQRHPAASVLGAAEWFDDIYDRADTMAQVYETILERIVDAATSEGEVLYAVPGSPLVAEATVRLLCADDRIDCEVLPALSFIDLTWARLGIDPIDLGVRLVDGHRFSIDAAGQSGPLLVCQCDSPMVLSDIKLSIEDWPVEPISVIQRLGLPDESITQVDWADLDRVVRPDHLTSLYMPSLAAPVAAELVRFDELVSALRTGCPWDRQQTHATLKHYLIEESYELLEAIDQFDSDTGEGADEVCEELGDVLFQVFFHATIAAESGWFDLSDVARTVHDKLYARHPHVFGGVRVSSSDELVEMWEHAKQQEKGRASIMDGIPTALPALLYALKVQKKAATSAGEPSDVASARAQVAEGLAGFDERADAEALGQLLFSTVDLARQMGIDAEDALRLATNRFRSRFEAMELSR